MMPVKGHSVKAGGSGASTVGSACSNSSAVVSTEELLLVVVLVADEKRGLPTVVRSAVLVANPFGANEAIAGRETRANNVFMVAFVVEYYLLSLLHWAKGVARITKILCVSQILSFGVHNLSTAANLCPRIDNNVLGRMIDRNHKACFFFTPTLDVTDAVIK